jgi:hypothetical protein
VRNPLLLVLCLAPFAGAQFTEAQTVKAAKASVKSALAQLKLDVKAARDTYVDAVDATQDLFEAGNGDLFALGDLFSVARDLQAAVQGAVQDAEEDMADGLRTAMAQMDGLDSLNGEIPAQLQAGAGGVPDVARAAIDKLLDKTYAALDARMNKLEAAIAKHTSFRLRVTMKPPFGSTAFLASAGASTVFKAGFGIDLIWVEHDNTLGDSGRLRIAGSQSDVDASGGLDVVVFEADATFHLVDDTVAVASGDRWSATLSGLDRGSHACLVQGHNDPPAASLAVAFNVPP